MKPTFYIIRGLKFLVFGTAFVALAGGVVMSLWNWLVPVLFQGPVISFWQGLGLLALSRILVGGFGGGGGRWGDKRHMHWKQKMEDRMANMSPEEKDKFKQQMKERWGKRCGNYGSFDEPKERESL